MFNLLKGEFYKLRKSKCFFVCCIASVAFILLIYGSLILVNKIMSDEVANGTMGVTVTAGDLQNGENIFEDLDIPDVMQQIFGSGFAAIITAVFTSIFVIGEFANGAVKNIVGKGYSRKKIFLAKYIAVSTAVVGMLLFISVVTVLIGFLFMGLDGINSAFFGNMVIYVCIEILLGLALNGIIIVINEGIRNAGGGISISICLIVFSTLITAGLDLLFHKAGFQISDYWIEDMMGSLPVSGFESGYVLRTVVIGLIWFIGAVVIGGLHFSKADVS